MLRRNLLIALALVVAVAIIASLGAFDGYSIKPPQGAAAKATSESARDLLWVNAFLHTCEEPDVVFDDVKGEAAAQGIVDRGGSGQGIKQLFNFTCFRILKELAGQDKGQFFGPSPPAIPPGCQATIEAGQTATSSKPGGPFPLCSR